MFFLYNLSIKAYGLVIWIASFFNKKAAAWIEGRNNWRGRLKEASKAVEEPIWMHCASLGEFEQGRPILEYLKNHAPNEKILLTFFSPSGFEVRKNTELADLVTYLPLDSPRNARDFIEITQPKLAIFVKYEFWHFFIKTLQQNNIPLILVAGIFRPSQLFFKPYGTFLKKILKRFDHIFVQNLASLNLLLKHNIEQTSLGGDTRVDRVIQMAQRKKDFLLVKFFAGSRPILICGSTHPADEPHLLLFIKNQLPDDWKVIIAPHDIHEHRINALMEHFGPKAIRYSEASAIEPLYEKKILIIDNIGMLAHLYQFGRIAYIGGGFGKGIHNLLEPMAFGLPCIFGPNFKKFDEARHITEKHIGFSIKNEKELTDAFNRLKSEDVYENAQKQILQYIHQNQGATQKVIDYLSRAGMISSSRN